MIPIRLTHVEQNIDLIINSATSASLIRKKLLQHPMSPMVESNQQLYYQTSSSTGIEVRITPEMLCPFLPGAAKLVHEIHPATPANLPYVSLVDLIVFKLDACGLRDSAQSKQQEVRDAAALLELATEHSALDLGAHQARVVEESLADVLRHSAPDRQKAWWQTRLMGMCDPDARKPPSEVLSDLIEKMSLDEASSSSASSSKRSSPAGSIVGRTPSSSSKTSLSSMASSCCGSSSSSSSSSGGHFVTSNSPVSSTGPGFPAGAAHSRGASKDLTCTIPRRPRKFSTSQHSPVKSHSRKKSVDQGRPKRHSQILGSLPSGSLAYNTSPTDDGSPGSPGVSLTARFESTPGDDKLVTDSYF